MDKLKAFFEANSAIFTKIVIGLAVVFVLVYLFKVIINKLGEVFREPLEVYKAYKDNAPHIKELNDRPKSVSGMDSVYIPQIARDFPHLNIEEFRKKATDSLIEVFNSIERQKINKDTNLSKSLIVKTNEIIEDHKSQSIVEHFDDVNFHRTVISKYIKVPGKVQIVFQTALQFVRYTLDNDAKVVKGDKDFHKQTRYNITMEYVQDINKIEEITKGSTIGQNCPNCGAPITDLGRKRCQHCGTEVVEVNVKSWSIADYEEI